eukprot:Mrub_04254.p1 GENE.Mrub_04254~~Mrub_04254.p1  ORF type:complete len:415 (+),score=115.62 Mrub_04254:22-1245(+)
MNDKNTAKKIPVTILTGFLGSGKTTLLNYILKSPDHKMRFAVIENEFGEIGVDDKIMKVNTDEDVVEVLNGCICCTVRGDLVDALKRIHSKIKSFDAVIIETTGLADPAPVAQTFFVDEFIEEHYKLDGICTLVDAKHIMTRLDEKKPEGVENESIEQLAFADRILLNKTDLIENDAEIVDKEAYFKQIESRIRAINSAAPIFRCQQSQIDVKNILNLDAFSLDRVLSFDPEFLNTDGEHQHDDTVKSCSSKVKGEMNFSKVQKFISSLIGNPEMAANLFRYKGVLAVRGMKKKFVFQGVHMIFSGGFSDDVEYKDNEERESRFVFIGRNLDKNMLIKGFEECVSEGDNLRFKIGDKVWANIGKWKEGTIIKLWDEGQPYRIRLNDNAKTEVFASIDSDVMVKARYE